MYLWILRTCLCLSQRGRVKRQPLSWHSALLWNLTLHCILCESVINFKYKREGLFGCGFTKHWGGLKLKGGRRQPTIAGSFRASLCIDLGCPIRFGETFWLFYEYYMANQLISLSVTSFYVTMYNGLKIESSSVTIYGLRLSPADNIDLLSITTWSSIDFL